MFLDKSRKNKRDTLLKSVIKLNSEVENKKQTEDIDKLLSKYDEYSEWLPILPLSRCPYTGEKWFHSIDNYGIDGLWWRTPLPIRPLYEKFGGKYICHTGSVSLRKPFPFTHWRALTGPDRPYILTCLLENQFPNVKAVLSSLKIGNFYGYLVVYYGNKKFHPDYDTGEYHSVDLPNDWGSDGIELSPYLDGNVDVLAKGYNPVVNRDFDFILKPWIEKEQLLWIDKDDKSLSIRKGIKNCPYLDLPTEHNYFLVSRGEWYPQEVMFKKWESTEIPDELPTVKHKKRKLKKRKKILRSKLKPNWY